MGEGCGGGAVAGDGGARKDCGGRGGKDGIERIETRGFLTVYVVGGKEKLDARSNNIE